LLNDYGVRKLGVRLFREHDQFKIIASRTHRFRSVDQPGFFSLAKDIARLTADSIDASALQKIVVPPKGEKWGSLKTLESIVVAEVEATLAHSVMGPLHGIYNLRLADAHLPKKELDSALKLARVNPDSPFVLQGYQLLNSCVSSLYKIAEILQPSTGEDGSAERSAL
jgi:hypothetical protein